MDALLDERGIAALRSALADYTVDGLHELVGLAGQVALSRGDLAGLERTLDDSRLADLVRLFLLGASLSPARAGPALKPLPLADALEAGLVIRAGDALRAGFDLRPYAERDGPTWWVISDLGSDVRPGPVAADHVLGIGAASVSLAQATIRGPVERALDVGTGCGIQALHLSRHSASVTATDISPRALRLAATTAALNGLSWDLRSGSLLEPVQDELFDLVVANPPFVISAGGVAHDYRDGGLAGDELCRRLVGELPGRLRAGGTAQLLANWAITPDRSWEERVSGWLSDSRYRSWIWQREVLEPGEYVELWLRDSGATPASTEWSAAYERWLSWFASERILAIGMGLITIRAEDGPVVCEDVRQGLDQPIGPEIAAWFGRQAWLDRHGDEALLRAWIRVASTTVLSTESEPGVDGWQIVGHRLRQSVGMRWDVETDESMSAIIGALDGSVPLSTPIQLLAAALDRRYDECAAAVLPVVRDLIGRGFLLPV